MQMSLKAAAWLAGLWFFLVFTSGVVCGQTYRFRVYTTNTGLPNNAVYAIYQDSHGYMWFGTDQGVSRYDGQNYINLSVPQGMTDAPVRALAEDQSGNLWVGTRGGISRFDGNTFTNFTPKDGLSNAEIRSLLCARDGTMWIGTASGLNRYEGGQFTQYGPKQGLPDKPIWAMIEDHNGMLWLALRGGGLARFDGETFVTYGLKDGLPNENVFDLAEDSFGSLWLATGAGMVQFQASRFRLYGAAEALPSTDVSNVLVDRNNQVWCGTFGGGVARLENGRFVTLNRSNGLPDDYITSMAEDYEGNLWCGTRWSGVCHLGSEMFANYTATSSGIGGGVITGVAQTPDGALWFASINSGLSRLDKTGQFQRFGVKDGLLEESIWAIFVDHLGRLWIGSSQGLTCYTDGKFQTYRFEQFIPAGTRISCIVEDTQGWIWLGSDSASSPGLLAFDGQQFRQYGLEQGLPHAQINALVRDREGTIWVCSDNGLSRFDGQSFHEIKGLPNKYVQCFHEDSQGQLWIGTSNGLCLIDRTQVLRVYRPEDGLVSNSVYCLTSVKKTLWIGTRQGISAFDGQQFRNFTVKDGLISNDISRTGSLVVDDGSIWFGTNEGAVHCRPDREQRLPVPPRLHINSIHVQGQMVGNAINVTFYRTQLPPPLRYDQNSITFEYVGLSFTNEAAVRYVVKLEGFDPEWLPPSTQRFARYTNLPPRRYRFLVKAQSSTGIWSDQQVVEIVIEPPFWQTWWFRFLVVAGVVGIGSSVYAWRIQTLEHRHQQKLASLRQLLESIRIINSQLALSTVLQNIAEESARLVGGQPGGIGLVEQQQVVFRQLWSDHGWQDTHLVFQFGQGVAGQVVASGTPLVVAHPEGSPDTAYPETVADLYKSGVLAVPIRTRTGLVVGVLEVRNRPGHKLFSETDCQLIESLANQAAVAIENAGLYGEVAVKNTELEEKNQMIGQSLAELERLYQQEQEVTRTLQELNQMKTNFIVVTSHEMRTPLTVLKGYNEALLGEFFGELSPMQQKSLNVSQRMIDRMVNSFNDILEMLKINEGVATLHCEPTDLTRLTNGVLEELSPFIEKRKQRVDLETSGQLMVAVDQEKLALVLMNLVQNAIKFTPDGGVIHIALKEQENQILLQVTDSGIGIDAGELERIFDKFYTTPDPSTHSSGRFEFSARGTGLGLAIAKSYVEAHGGRIWAESPGKGQGSTFRVELPVQVTE